MRYIRDTASIVPVNIVEFYSGKLSTLKAYRLTLNANRAAAPAVSGFLELAGANVPPFSDLTPIRCDNIAPSIANEGLIATASPLSKIFVAISKQRITSGEIASWRQGAHEHLWATMVVIKRLCSVKMAKRNEEGGTFDAHLA
ncbi:hypothetical protein V491_05871 [Pseudogymnoascus sp. VKM F-3775]|nr:hypothetical protein V491_05871 [Pseudogymnoascus sp. VKM F-3775]